MRILDRLTTGFPRFAKHSKNAGVRHSTLALLAGGLALSTAVPAAAVEITVWSGYPEMGPYYERVATGLKKKYPDLVVNVQAIPLREHEKRIALSLPSGAAADIIELQDSTAQRFLEASLLKPAPADVSKFVSSEASYEPHVRKAATFDGKVFGVPLFRGQSALYYNTEMFAKAGLSGPPKTMEEYTEYAKKLTQRDASGTPLVSGWSLRLTGGGQGIAEKFWINLHQFGGALLKQTSDGKWVASYATPEGRAALKQYVENVQVLKTVTPEMKADAEAFELGQTAMFIREIMGHRRHQAEGAEPEIRDRAAPQGIDRTRHESLCHFRGREGQARLGIRHGGERAREPLVGARQCRLADEPQGRRLFPRRQQDAGAWRLYQLSEGLHVLLASRDRADRGDPLPPRGAADEGL